MAREAFVALLAEKQEDLDSRSTWTDVQRLIEFNGRFLAVHHSHRQKIWEAFRRDLQERERRQEEARREEEKEREKERAMYQ